MLPDGAVGDLQFSGPGVTPGYWRNEEATRAAFTDDGWLRSGDLARRDADGFYWIAGRRKEMFISGGENVYPAEVENVLSAHPDVVDVAVLAEADPKWGEVGRAFVQLAPLGGHPDGAALDAFCRERLAPYKVPAPLRLRRRIPAHLGGEDPEASAGLKAKRRPRRKKQTAGPHRDTRRRQVGPETTR